LGCKDKDSQGLFKGLTATGMDKRKDENETWLRAQLIAFQKNLCGEIDI
jgi:hypothetical protein